MKDGACVRGVFGMNGVCMGNVCFKAIELSQLRAIVYNNF